MPTTSPRAALAAAAIAAALTALAVSATAGAALPVFRDTTIVPGKSIGGVALGASAAKARAAWGRPGGQCTDVNCYYRSSGDSSGVFGEGTFSFSPKVAHITLKAGVDRNGFVFRKPFTIPKTDRGIGIGSTITAVKKAYPKARQVRGSKVLTLAGGNRIQTAFWWADENRVTQIVIESLGR